MDKDTKIYVAGHTGLVGSALIRRLEGEGYKNLVVKASKELDLRQQAKVEEFFKKEKPDYVFLAAAKVGGILANSTYKAEFIYDNIMIAANVINSAYKSGVKKLLNLGSSCIYPKESPQPMKEGYLLSGKLEPTNEPYAVAKISAIKLCRYYNEQYGTNFISVMPANLYGPGDNFNLETSHLLASLIRKFNLAKLLNEHEHETVKKDLIKNPMGFGLEEKINLDNNQSVTSELEKSGITKEKVVLWGSGEPFREFLYVDDLAEACVFLMRKYDYNDIGEFINIGTGRDLKIKELAEIVKNIIGFSGRIEWDRSKPDGTPRKLLDVSRLKKLGYMHGKDLASGVEETYNWYLDNLE